MLTGIGSALRDCARAFNISSFVLFPTILAGPACAQVLVYRPFNPRFGGNAFTSSRSFASATGQNHRKEKATEASPSRADECTGPLPSRLLAALAGDSPHDRGDGQLSPSPARLEADCR